MNIGLTMDAIREMDPEDFGTRMAVTDKLMEGFEAWLLAVGNEDLLKSLMGAKVEGPRSEYERGLVDGCLLTVEQLAKSVKEARNIFAGVALALGKD